jgi:protein-disulfide isomerase
VSREQKVLLAALAAFVVLVVGLGVGIQAWRTSRAPSTAPTVVPSFGPVTIAEGRPIPLGSADAPATLRLYSDFHCPHCAEFEEKYSGVLNDALARGSARIDLYPMAFIDEGSSAASNAMACAAEGGFGYAYYTGLYANRTLRWSDDQLLELARVVGAAATPEFQDCVTTRAHADWVASINTVADEEGVTGTPALFLNDQPVDVSKLTPEILATMIADAA